MYRSPTKNRLIFTALLLVLKNLAHRREIRTDRTRKRWPRVGIFYASCVVTTYYSNGLSETQSKIT